MGSSFLFLFLMLTLCVPVSFAQTTAVDYYNRGVDKFDAKDYDGAIADFTKKIQSEPNSKDAYNMRGLSRMLKRDFQGAIDDYDKVIELDPKASEAFSNRGTTRVWMGDYESSVADFTRVIELGDLSAYLDRAWSRFFMNDADGAYQDAAIFLQQNGLKGYDPPYVVIVGYLGLRKAGKTVAANTFLNTWRKQLVADEWNAKILSFFSGELTSAQLLALAVDNKQMLEAHTYIGEMEFLAGDRANARPNFQWVKANGKRTLAVETLALVELRRLEAVPAKPVSAPKKKS